jgi:histidinol-phosphate/aromatic aminotransferase/cobyric acid decarboxylase-like protein
MSASTSEPRVHGGLDPHELAARGMSPGDVVDFSVNVNPYGPCASVLAALRAAPLDRYPDPRGERARAAWAARLGVPVAGLAVGHGASDLFWAIARALLGPGRRALIAEPTFSEFRVAAAAAGAEVERVWPAHGLALDLEQLAYAARGAAALYLCSPNNPTGEYLSPARVSRLAEAAPECTLVLDQSFLALSDHAADEHAPLPGNVIVVRSLTKDLALPGLRIGIAVGAPPVMARVEAMRPSWATSAPALAAIEAGAGAAAFVAASWARMRADRDAVAALLTERGYAPCASEASYLLVPVGDGARFRSRLLDQGVQVRDARSFGLAGHVRVAALPAPAQRRLAHALAHVDPR